MSERKILVSCEHADKIIPKAYQHLFTNGGEDLLSHKGYDPGSFELGKYVARELHAPLYYQKVSRLLIEMNRSLYSNELFSVYSKDLPSDIKKELIAKYYTPYRGEVEDKIIELLNQGEKVLHLSMHTFTPSLNGVERIVDVGILCDEEKKLELDFSNDWKDKLTTQLPDKLTMINMPYNGADDGFTTYLRNKYNQTDYLGIELEINQKYINTSEWQTIKKAVVNSLL